MKNAKKTKMKTMYAAVQAIHDRKDLEDSSVEIVGVYATKKAAQAAANESRLKFLKDIVDPDEDIEAAEAVLEEDCDRTYDWFVKKVKVEA